jgi:ubiquitin carboxyl-terminal hydrolase 25/28
MALINKRYTEPSEVLRALVDDFGQPLPLGEQKDIGEFNLNFLERVEEGLGERKEAKNWAQLQPSEERASEELKEPSK